MITAFRMKHLILAVVLLHSTQAFSAADKTPLFRPCTLADVQGTWKLDRLDENPRGQEAYFFNSQMPYQYMEMDSTGRYYFAYSNVEYREEKNIAALLKLASKDLGLFYDADNKGVLIIKDAKRVTDQHSCNVALKDVHPFLKGDLVLSQGRKTPVPTQTTRMYRRMTFKK